MSDIWEVLQQGYMQRAVIAALIVGAVCPSIGMYVVLKRLSLIGDGLGHLAFAGVAAGWLTGIYPLVTAGIFTVLGAVGIERLRSWSREYGDMALAIVFYSGIALGIVLTGLARGMNASLLGYLFGSILTVSSTDLVLIGASALVVMTLMLLLRKELFLLSYDEDLARVSGLPARLLNYLIVILAALTVVAALRVVGILLVAGLLVVPVSASLQLARSFNALYWYALFFGILSTMVGLVASYLFNLAPGGSIILTSVLIFVLASLVGTRRAKRRTS